MIDEATLPSAGWYLVEARIPKGVKPHLEIEESLFEGWRRFVPVIATLDADGIVNSFVDPRTPDTLGTEAHAGGTHATVDPVRGEATTMRVSLNTGQIERTGRYQLLVGAVSDLPMTFRVRFTEAPTTAPADRITVFSSTSGRGASAVFDTDATIVASDSSAIAAGALRFDHAAYIFGGPTLSATTLESPAGPHYRFQAFGMIDDATGTWDVTMAAQRLGAVVGFDVTESLVWF